MNETKSSIARRDFLRIAGIAGLGVAVNFQRARADVSVECPALGSICRGEILVGLDIGTSKVCVAVAERMADGTTKLLGIGRAPSRGVRKGEIVDTETARKCVHEALVNAEAMSDVMIQSVHLGITGPHIDSFNNRGMVSIPEDLEEVTEVDCESVRADARLVGIPSENMWIHSLLQHYYVDGQESVLSPVGMTGHKLGADFHFIHGIGERIKKTVRCVKWIPLEVEKVVFNPLAAAEAVLDSDQKKRGALVIDIGAGTTDYLVYEGGAVTYSGCVPIGGNHITTDLAMALRISMACAEKLKTEEGSVTAGSSKLGECTVIKVVSGNLNGEFRSWGVNTVIHLSAREILEPVKKRLKTDGVSLNSLGAGVQLTGGGSLLRGIDELAGEVFELPAYLAHVKRVSGSTSEIENPRYSCAIGLVKLACARTSLT
jgi:cell division protein FtsA